MRAHAMGCRLYISVVRAFADLRLVQLILPTRWLLHLRTRSNIVCIVRCAQERHKPSVCNKDVAARTRLRPVSTAAHKLFTCIASSDATAVHSTKCSTAKSSGSWPNGSRMVSPTSSKPKTATGTRNAHGAALKRRSTRRGPGSTAEIEFFRVCVGAVPLCLRCSVRTLAKRSCMRHMDSEMTVSAQH